MVDSAFVFQPEALTAMNGIVGRSVKWCVLRIPEGADAGCELVASGTQSGTDDASSEADFLAFSAAMPDKEPRWGIYDLNFLKGGVNCNKIVFT